MFKQQVETARTALFCPSDRPDRVGKAIAGISDIVIVDLEDAVAADKKNEARKALDSVLRSDAGFGERAGIVVRINPPTGATEGLGQDDLRALAATREAVSGEIVVMVAKTESVDALNHVRDIMGEQTSIIALVETAKGALNAHEIAQHPQVIRLAFGAIDFSAEAGCTPDSLTAWHARAQLVLASTAAGISSPIESPCPVFQDPEPAQQAARKAKENGFTGMLSIHPKQLQPIHDAYAPSEADIEWAKRVVAAGDGASSIDGQMIDRPVILRAQAVLEYAQRS